VSASPSPNRARSRSLILLAILALGGLLGGYFGPRFGIVLGPDSAATIATSAGFMTFVRT